MIKAKIQGFLRGLDDEWKDLGLKNEDGRFGHYSTNAAFEIARKTNRKLNEVAEKMAGVIRQKDDGRIFREVQVAGQGFINFRLNWSVLRDGLNKVLSNPKKWGEGRSGESCGTVVLEYFQPNVAKTLHVGHLRSAVIGDALKRILKIRSFKTVSDTHIGDWGTQFGILLYGFGKLSGAEKDELRKKSIDGLNELYVRTSKMIEEKPELREEAKMEFALLEKGDKERRKVWEWMVKESQKDFDVIKKELGLIPFEEERGESFYEKEILKIAEEAVLRGVAKKKPFDSFDKAQDKPAQGVTGAVTVDLNDEGLDEAVLIKSDGASTYLLRDLATIKYRAKKWRFKKNLYVVDVRQALHFKQVFRVAELLGLACEGKSEHLEFGFMSLPEGAMSTRKGSVIALAGIIEDVIQRAREVIRDKNPDLKNAEKTARAIGIGALKYFDLSHHRRSNIVFDRERSLSFEGNTAPYIQYTNVRMLSVLRKAGGEKNNLIKETGCEGLEEDLIFEALRLPEVLDDVLLDYDPSALARYLFDLARKANEWYQKYPILQEGDRSKRIFRLGIARAISASLTKGLYCLGIDAPEEM